MIHGNDTLRTHPGAFTAPEGRGQAGGAGGAGGNGRHGDGSEPRPDQGGKALSIAYLSPGWPASACSNGIVTYTNTIKGAMETAGHRVFVLVRRVRGAYPPDRTVVDLQAHSGGLSLAQRVAGRIRFARDASMELTRRCRRQVIAGIRDLHRREGVQLLEMEESFGIAGQIVRDCPVPVVVRLHGPHFLVGAVQGVLDTKWARVRIEAERSSIASADAITAPSRFVLDQVRDHYGLALEEARVIPNPVGASSAEAPWSYESCRRDTLLFVGRFDRIKGGDVMIRAFGELCRAGIECRLVFVGPDKGVTDEDGRTWDLPAYVRAHVPEGARERVQCLGFQPPEAVQPLRRQALVTAVPSRMEMFPNTAIEAMSLGCPVVASDTGGLPEAVRDGHSGLLCAPGDAADLARKLKALLTDPQRAAALGAQALRDCRARYDPHLVAQETAAFYREVLARRGARSGGS